MARGGCVSDFVTETLMTSKSSITTERSDALLGVPIHPGRILKRELAARALSANALARAMRVDSGRIVMILNGKRAITGETALRLGRFLGTGPQLWMNLQASYDLARAQHELGTRIEAEVAPAPV
jgi:antitoxin HigA-1